MSDVFFVVGCYEGDQPFVRDRVYDNTNGAIREARYLRNVFNMDTTIYQGFVFEPGQDKQSQLSDALDTIKALTAENEKLREDKELLNRLLNNQEDALSSCSESFAFVRGENDRLTNELDMLRTKTAELQAIADRAEEPCQTTP